MPPSWLDIEGPPTLPFTDFADGLAELCRGANDRQKFVGVTETVWSIFEETYPADGSVLDDTDKVDPWATLFTEIIDVLDALISNALSGTPTQPYYCDSDGTTYSGAGSEGSGVNNGGRDVEDPNDAGWFVRRIRDVLEDLAYATKTGTANTSFYRSAASISVGESYPGNVTSGDMSEAAIQALIPGTWDQPNRAMIGTDFGYGTITWGTDEEPIEGTIRAAAVYKMEPLTGAVADGEYEIVKFEITAGGPTARGGQRTLGIAPGGDSSIDGPAFDDAQAHISVLGSDQGAADAIHAGSTDGDLLGSSGDLGDSIGEVDDGITLPTIDLIDEFPSLELTTIGLYFLLYCTYGDPIVTDGPGDPFDKKYASRISVGEEDTDAGFDVSYVMVYHGEVQI